jgi:maltose alpha-D-glucosyltransferase/alpha-amylase
MERIIRMRKEIPEIGCGDFSFLPLRTHNVLAMAYEWRNNCVLFLNNLISEPQEVRFRLPAKCRGDKNLLVNLLSGDNSEADRGGRHCVVLEPYGYRWYRVGGLDYLLRRSDT